MRCAAALGVVALGATAGMASATSTASLTLGTSNVTVTYTDSVGVSSAKGPTRRTLIFHSPAGRTRVVVLKNTEMSGSALRVYYVPHSLRDTRLGFSWDQFVFIGTSDCITLETVKFRIMPCTMTAGDALRRRRDASYIGRFDFANGFDRPKGRFGYNLRFLPAWETGG